MDIGSILGFIIGAVIALALGWIGWQDWQKATREQRLATIRRVVLSVDEYAKASNAKGSAKLVMALERLKALLPDMPDDELDEQIHATVAELNQGRKPAIETETATGTVRSPWYE